jgi:NADH-quinone oxidoreductase E subunit|tara:strand:- start:313 stop:921 length:609 start_codon:yes stop_codon:yes gene_type:complete
MSLRKPSKEQPDKFEFNAASLEAAKTFIAKYPKGKQQSAVMALLYIAQKQNNNWIPLVAMKYIAKLLEMPYIKVYEVATFYTMYNLTPVGKYFIQVCTTTPCMIRGAYKIVEACKEKISDNENQLSKNKNCSWTEVECLGACVNAPMMQINDDYYEDLDKEKTLKILDQVLNDEKLKPGSYRGRVNNEPENNRKTLMDIKNA